MRLSLDIAGRVLVCLLACASAARAQVPQTWVSGVGDDANPCSRTAPCKTFAGAISKTVAGGEIDALDPGGFGAITITKAITIDGGGGFVSSILVSGTPAIVISAGASDRVTIRNLRITGISGQGTTGIRFLAGASLHVENVSVFGFNGNGIEIFPSTAATTAVVVQDTSLTENVGGFLMHTSGTGTAMVSLSRLQTTRNLDFGVKIDGTGGSGPIVAALTNVISAHNVNGLNVLSGPGSANVMVTRSTFANNAQNGLRAKQAGGSTATIRVGSSVISGNNFAAVAIAGGAILTYGNNQANGNITSDGTFSGPVGLQ